MQVVRSFLARWVPKLKLIAITLLPIVSAAALVKPDTYQEPWRSVLGYVDTYQLGATISLAVLSAVLEYAQEALEGWTPDRRRLKQIVDAIHAAYFKDVPQESLYLHRVTLFKAGPWWKTRKTRLEIYERSGTAFAHSRTWFSVSDEDEPANQGAAGRAWFVNAQVTITDLPEWPQDPADSALGVKKVYADRGWLPVQKAEQLTVKSRSVDATVLRESSGRRWGVLVVDSREPQGVSDSEEKRALVALAADLLMRTL